MTPQLSLQLAATALVACLAGWHLRGALPRDEAAAQDRPVPAAATTPVLPAAMEPPTIVVSSDGQVTLRVEQQPLEWVLEQLAAQGGILNHELRSRPSDASMQPAAGPRIADCADPATTAAARAAALLQTLQQGSAQARYQGILLARNEGVVIPDEMLRTLFETDASDAVRLLAFEAYLERRSGHAAATREALDNALRLGNSAMNREAQRRLDESAEAERMHAMQGAPR